MSVMVQPVTCHRHIGGWLAVSPSNAKFRIGTVGVDEQDASERFREAWRRWTESVNDQIDTTRTQTSSELNDANAFGVSAT